MANEKSIIQINTLDCMGCGLCSEICPKRCISMIPDDEGFLAPKIDAEMCIDCGVCLKNCPAANAADSLFFGEPRSYFCGTIKDDDILLKSSSGGVFGVLAKHILGKKGYVCGCIYNDDMMAVHAVTNDNAVVEKMYGSKYVQSRSDECFAEIKDKLDLGEKLLFTGTACQIAALRIYLRKKYDNLICVEILCHGVPSPMFFRKYVKYLEKKLHGRIESVQFRNKEKHGWGSEHRTCVVYNKNGKQKKYRPILPAYFSAFFYGINLRESCYLCKFAKPDRIADLTIGDFWGSWEKFGKRFTEGISVVGINSEKGQDLIGEVKEEFSLFEILGKNEAVRSNDNFEHPIKRPPERDCFYNGFEKKYKGAWKKAYFTKTYRKKTLASVYGALVPAKWRYLRHKLKKR